jgi:hypothetical protein
MTWTELMLALSGADLDDVSIEVETPHCGTFTLAAASVRAGHIVLYVE